MRAAPLTRSALAAALLASTSSASEPPRPNLVVIDGLAGVWSVSTKDGGESRDTGLVVGSTTATSRTDHPLRLGYHRALGSLTLGGGLHYGTSAGLSSQLVAAPRVGAWIGGGSLAIWPRAGVTYGRSTIDIGRESDTADELMLAAELLFVAPLAPHVGLSFGPGVELGVSGSHDSYGQTHEVRSRVIGAQLGLVADF